MYENADGRRQLEEELPEVESRTAVEPGIKGWLVLHAIGIVIVTGIMGLMSYGAISQGLSIYLIVLPLFLLTLFLTVSFFQHKKYVPTLMRFLLAFSVLQDIAKLATDGFGYGLLEGEVGITLFGMGFTVIWFIYYGVSERVKATFTK